MDNHFKNYFNLDKINITGRIKTKLGMNLSHEFIFSPVTNPPSQPLSINFYFSLPIKSTVSNFEIICGDTSIKSSVSELDSHMPYQASLNQIDKINFRLSILDIDFGDYQFSINNFVAKENTPIILKVYSVLIFENSKNSASAQIPLSTRTNKIKDQNNKNYISAKTSIKIIEEKTDDTKYSNIYSTTHTCVSNLSDENLILQLETESTGIFGLHIDYYKEFKNRVYITGDSISGYKAVYLFKPNVIDKNKCYDIVYFLDTSKPKSNLDRIAKTALIEFLKNQPHNTRFGICTTDGRIYHNKIIMPKYNIIRDVEKWLAQNHEHTYHNEVRYESHSGIFENISRLIKQSIFAEIIYITTSDSSPMDDVLDILTRSIRVPVNIFSVAATNYSLTQKKLAENTKGIHSIMQKGHNFCEFTKSFMTRMFSDYLTNLEIYENSAGTYYNTPSKIDLYRTKDIITYTLASTTEYPIELFLRADGDFRDHILFENPLIIRHDTDTEVIFGHIILNSIHNYIMSNALTPESVLTLKKTAVKLCRELNILSQYTACTAQIDLGLNNIISNTAPLEVNLYLSGKISDEFRDIVTIFGDIDKLDIKTRIHIIEKCLRILLLCLNPDNTFSNSNTTDKAKTKIQTAYSAQAIICAVDKFNLPYSESYRNIANKAIEAIGGQDKFSAIPIIYDSSDTPRLSDCTNITKSLDIVKISRLIVFLTLNE